MEVLQIIWFLLIVVLLTGYAVLDGFDLGSGFWHLFSLKDIKERTMTFHAIAPMWDGNEVWLLTGGGAIFAAFPFVYATVFSGLYLALILVLVGLIFRAVSIEFRIKAESDNERKIWDIIFSISSILPALLFGVALGNLLVGLPMDENGDYTGTFFMLLNPFSLLIGVTGLLLIIFQASIFLSLKYPLNLAGRVRQGAIIIWPFCVVFLTLSGVLSVVIYNRGNYVLPIIFVVFALISLVYARVKLKVEIQTFSTLVGSSLALVFSLSSIAALLFPNLVPSRDGFNNLTIFNSSSSQLTLTVMLVLALIGVPIVLWYTIYVYNKFKGRVSNI